MGFSAVVAGENGSFLSARDEEVLGAKSVQRPTTGELSFACLNTGFRVYCSLKYSPIATDVP